MTVTGKKVLLVDDEQEIRELMTQYLVRERFTVTEADSGAIALELLNKTHFDIIVLDIMLGDLDGFEVIRRIRLAKINSPVIFLSARQEEHEKILGFGLGADDYVTKPFSPAELTARIKAHLRRTAAVTLGSYSAASLVRGPFVLELESYTVYKNDEKIELSAKELKLLKFFMENPNRVFTKKQIYRNVWDDEWYDDNSVMVYISHLREKIKDDSKEAGFIQTLRGIGYKFCI